MIADLASLQKRRTSLVAVLVVTVASMVVGSRLMAAEKGGESLGGQLLNDLDPQKFAPPPEQPSPARPDFQKRILPDVTDGAVGEDAGPLSAIAPLVSARRNMQSAESLLRDAQSLDRVGPAQQQAVNDLDTLIEQLARQCQGNCQSSGQCNSPSMKPATAGAKPSAGGKGSSPARDSTAELRRGDPQAAKPGDRQAAIKELWGHLPPQAREQMLQMYSDEFLPEYELEIEAYFRRLAEEGKSRGPN